MSTNSPATNAQILAQLQALQSDVTSIKNSPVAVSGAVDVLNGVLATSEVFVLPSKGLYRIIANGQTRRSMELACKDELAGTTSIAEIGSVAYFDFWRRIGVTNTLSVSFTYPVQAIYKL